MVDTNLGYPANADNIQVSVVRINRINFAYQLPGIPVSRGKSLLIRARFTNAGLILVGPTQASAIDANQSALLQANEWVAYRVKNANVMYVSGNAAGDLVEISAEWSQGD